MSGDSGSVLKVHDYIGLSEVSSTLSHPPFAADALPSPQYLNLEETDLRLGLGPAKKPDAPKLPCEKPLALLPDPHPEKPRQPEKLKPLSDAKYSEDQRPSQASLPQSQSGRNGSQPCLSAAQDFAYEAPKIVNGYGRPVMVPALPSKNGMKRGYDNISGAVHFSSSGDGRPPVSAISGAAKNGDFDVKSLPKHQQGAFLPNWAPSKSSVPVPWHVGLDQPVSSNKPAVPKPATAAAYKPCDPVENPSDVATTDAPPSKSRVVGWPPVATFRKQQTIAKPTEMFVKVNMDGITVGRKVDLNAHSSYDSLFQALEDMFQPSLNAQSSGRDSVACEKQCWLRNGLDYVLTYEDKDGDWMLVGDVPWSFFVNTVKRLRIVRGSDATGSAPRGPDIA